MREVFTVLIIFGFTLSLSQESVVVSVPILSCNRLMRKSAATACNEEQNLEEEYCENKLNDYIKLPSGSNIYFYTTEKENFLVGYKLCSKEEIAISFLKGDSDFRDRPPRVMNSNTETETMIYTVLKNGILIPRADREKKNELNSERSSYQQNKCVYQSVKPTYFVKGFKNILIPADVLYSDSVQKEIFNSNNCLGKKVFNGRSEEQEIKGSVFSKKLRSFFSKFAANQKNEFLTDDTEEKRSPDQTCNGEVALFDLKNDGILKRVLEDPNMPFNMHVSYSLLSDFAFQPHFSGNSDLKVSFQETDKNGDLIPHVENSLRITGETASSVTFLSSKNGASFPFEERKYDKFFGYFFGGEMVHDNEQFLETHSNSTIILLNSKRVRLNQMSGAKNRLNKLRDRFTNKFSNKIVVKTDCGESFDSNLHRRLHKREALLSLCQTNNIKSDNNCSRSRRNSIFNRSISQDGFAGNDSFSLGIKPLRGPRVARNALTEANYDVEYACSDARNHDTLYRGRGAGALLPLNPNIRISDSKFSDLAIDQDEDTSGKSVSSHFYGSRKPFSGARYAPYTDAEDTPDQQREKLSDVHSPTWDRPLLKARTDIFIFDEKGTRIRLIPEITDSNDVVIYKLTCKGNLVRYPPCKEPEFGFEINFQLLMDEFVLIPTISIDKPFHLTYVLQENGDLIPAEENTNTFRKAPGSLIYFMLGKNNILFPVQQVIDMDGNVSFFYQDFFLLKMKDTVDKPLHFTTKGCPLFAFFNGLTMLSMSSKPRLNYKTGSHWNQLKPSESSVSPLKTMYLSGPKGELVKIIPYKNRQGATVIYELDCNGILYRSPKDKKKCIILKSYVLLKEGILVPSNDTSGYVYMMSKNGDLFPYLYPDGKIEAPLASSLKYVLCEKGILLPIKLEIIDNFICYLFRDVVVYKERVYCRNCLDRLNEQQLQNSNKHKKSSCDVHSSVGTNFNESNIELFVNKNGDYVYYEKQNKILKRHPPEKVPPYLKYTMGSFEVKEDGSLHQTRYQDPSENVANLMLEPNGDLLEDSRNVNNIRSEFYVLDSKGNLIAVQVRKMKNNLHFYRGFDRVCKIPMPLLDRENAHVNTSIFGESETPLGKDPLKLMEDPFPSSSNEGLGDTPRSLYIPIPLKSVSVSKPLGNCPDRADPEHKKKCEILKDTLKQMSKGNSLPLALELELTDDIIEELKNWAAKCDKVLVKRETPNAMLAYLTTLRDQDKRKVKF